MTQDNPGPDDEEFVRIVTHYNVPQPETSSQRLGRIVGTLAAVALAALTITAAIAGCVALWRWIA